MTAAEAIVKLANENAGELNLLCIAPLTNIALALSLDPSLPSKIKEVFILGGTIHGKGNFHKNLEFNFGIDPHAARLVFQSFKMINLVPWEASHEYKITTEEMHVLFDENHVKTKFYKEINNMNVGRFGHIDYCDGLAAALAVDRSIATTVYELEGEVYCEGDAAG